MSNSEQLEKVESTLKPSNNEKDLNSLTTSIVASFSLIEAWNEAQSSDLEVQKIIESVKMEGGNYYKALERSKSVAQHGFTFCGNGSRLCDFLLGENTLTELIGFIDEMKTTAALAHKEAHELSEQFRSVRRGLFQIMQRIPTEVERISQNEAHARELKDKLEMNGGKTFKRRSMLDWRRLIKEIGKNDYEKRSIEREREVVHCTEAKKQLSDVTLDLDKLAEHLGVFATWWIGQSTRLLSLRTNISLLDESQIRKLRVQTIKTDWDNVQTLYLQYKTTITRLQDYCTLSLEPDTKTSEQLEKFESIPKPTSIENDLNPLISSIIASFRLIEPWNDAQSSDSGVQKIIESVKVEGVNYYQALERSKSVAQHSFALCSGGSALCNLLREDNKVTDLIGFIDEMKKTATLAYEEAQELSLKFWSVKTGMLQITEKIPAEDDRITKNELQARDMIEKSTKSLKKWAALPGMKSHYQKKLIEFEIQILECTNARARLSKITSDFDALEEHLNVFATWWIGQETRLHSLAMIRTNISLRDGNQMDKRIQDIQSDWDKARTSYMQYVTKMNRLQEYWPAPSTVRN